MADVPKNNSSKSGEVNPNQRDKPKVLPESTFRRTQRLASLPVGFAGRKALGLGKRIGGQSAEMVSDQIKARTAEQLFSTLGELKGGAMKLGQTLSVMEVALPEETMAPYREQLTKLQAAAPPMASEAVFQIMEEELGSDWRDRFQEFNDEPAAAASIGQVHRGISSDGRDVAIKIQYPGALQAIKSDFKQMARLAKLFSILAPGLDIKPLLRELEDRLTEELDYIRESQAQRTFAAAYEGDPEFVIPHVLAAGPHVIVSEWIEGTQLSQLITEGSKEERDHAGDLYFRFLLSGPARAGLLHADPHPGNYMITPDGKLAVLDFGAHASLPDGFPPAIGRLISVALEGKDSDEVVRGLRQEGFLKPQVKVNSLDVMDYFSPLIEPLRNEEFHFSREWIRAQFQRIRDPREGDLSLSVKFNMPPQYLLIHRVWMGSIAVLSQLDATIPARESALEWVPAFTG
ncbi:MAG: AarF/ABC1/UbiB kinase family protein [Candidatus Nanopelagicales bacterium]